MTGAPFSLDVLGFHENLSVPARAALGDLEETLRTRIAPLLAEAWEQGRMPGEVLDALIPLKLMTPPGVAPTEAQSSLFAGLRNFVLARTDVSVATLYNAQSGLFRTTVRLGGTPEQAAALLPRIEDFSLAGVFALTEPDHGSDIARGMATTAEYIDGNWRITGAKRWIGGAVSADVLAVFARDVADHQVKAFLVPRTAPGVQIHPMHGKIALRMMQNAHIELTDVRVGEDARLGCVNGWRDVSRILGAMRADVAWIATGLQAGALEAALRYVREREQFGRPIGSFQLVQEKLARILGNLTASLAMVTRLSQRQDAADHVDADSAMAKMWTSLHARESVALAREVLGGNGILLENDVARFFADAEAVYSYEGTHEINALIVGRALTGTSAFV